MFDCTLMNLYTYGMSVYIPHYLTVNVPAFEDDATKVEKLFALNNSGKTPVDVKESFEEVLENKTKTSNSFSDKTDDSKSKHKSNLD
jgi:hypothetical protein